MPALFAFHNEKSPLSGALLTNALTCGEQMLFMPTLDPAFSCPGKGRHQEVKGLLCFLLSCIVLVHDVEPVVPDDVESEHEKPPRELLTGFEGAQVAGRVLTPFLHPLVHPKTRRVTLIGSLSLCLTSSLIDNTGGVLVNHFVKKVHGRALG
jgi:hypothetical protein